MFRADTVKSAQADVSEKTLLVKIRCMNVEPFTTMLPFAAIAGEVTKVICWVTRPTLYVGEDVCPFRRAECSLQHLKASMV